MNVTAYDIAQRFIGTKEVAGIKDNPLIVAMLRLDESWPGGDAVPWCSAFANFVAWLLRLPRSKNLMARSWLGVGLPVSLHDAKPGFDVVILRQTLQDPDASKQDFRGHVGFFAGLSADKVLVLGGNQHDAVNVAQFDANLVLGVRRLLS